MMLREPFEEREPLSIRRARERDARTALQHRLERSLRWESVVWHDPPAYRLQVRLQPPTGGVLAYDRLVTGREVDTARDPGGLIAHITAAMQHAVITQAMENAGYVGFRG